MNFSDAFNLLAKYLSYRRREDNCYRSSLNVFIGSIIKQSTKFTYLNNCNVFINYNENSITDYITHL